jgi:DNA polymerase-3 subunit delta'
MPNALIFGGRMGIGKATLAWRLAKFIMANPDHRHANVLNAKDLAVDYDHPAVQRLHNLSHGDVSLLRRVINDKTKKFYTEIRVDDTRKILDKFHQSASEDGWRIALIDCADDLNASSANALLKLIEEPPAKSLFLIIAHHPQRVLPTIRSRSRMMHMDPLSPQEVIEAITGLLGGRQLNNGHIQNAAIRSGGSVRDGLRLLGDGGLELAERVEKLMAGLPHVDWAGVFELSDLVCGRDGEDDFGSTIATIYDWLNHYVEARATAPAEQLAPLAEVWDKIAKAVRHAEALNLDKRALLLSIFSDLSAALVGTAADPTSLPTPLVTS